MQTQGPRPRPGNHARSFAGHAKDPVDHAKDLGVHAKDPRGCAWDSKGHVRGQEDCARDPDGRADEPPPGGSGSSSRSWNGRDQGACSTFCLGLRWPWRCIQVQQTSIRPHSPSRATPHCRPVAEFLPCLLSHSPNEGLHIVAGCGMERGCSMSSARLGAAVLSSVRDGPGNTLACWSRPGLTPQDSSIAHFCSRPSNET